ncbi:MAG: hypothetical protein LW884_11345 [Bacteroidetes bacterium]|jgi:hypothetical protein|nr:hypothetical protein [Bacteroidota bacterium]
MIKKPYLANLACAALLILAGLYSYLSNESRPGTALIGPVFGLLLLVLTPGLKRENKVVAHLVVVLTLLFGLMSLYMGFLKAPKPGIDPDTLARRNLVFAAFAIACFGAMVVYVLGFIQKRKAGQQAA